MVDMFTLTASVERWPLREPFRISRRTFVDSMIFTVKLDSGKACGIGESEPHEWDDCVAQAILQQAQGLALENSFQTLNRHSLQEILPAGPLRCAFDCAFWDLESKLSGKRAWANAGITVPESIRVMPTIPLGTVDQMAKAARSCRGAETVKIELGAGDGLDDLRLDAVAQALGGIPVLIDANGGFDEDALECILRESDQNNVVVIEQPFVPGLEHLMPAPTGSLRFCADESCIDRKTLPALIPHFQMINIKLDKCGGLTEGLALAAEATQLGLSCMVGSNGGSSLSVAPASLFAAVCEFADLGTGHLQIDRQHPMTMHGDRSSAPLIGLWG